MDPNRPLQNNRQQTLVTNTTAPPTTLYAVSDGSVSHGRGTYGWVKATKTQITDSSFGHVEGPPGNITSFRAEAQGLADLIYHKTINENTQIYLDNEAVIKKVNATMPLHPMQSEWELLEPVRQQVQQRHLKIQYVRGHQNMNNPKTPWEARLNHKADHLAAQAHKKHTQPGYLPRGYKVLLYIQDAPITTKYTAEIIRAAHTPEIRQYYREKYKWTDETLATLDWEAYDKALKRMKMSDQRTIHKFTHNWLPTGH